MQNDQLALTPSGLRSFNRWHLVIAVMLALLLLLLPWLFNMGPNSWRTDCAAQPAAMAPTAKTPLVALSPVAPTASPEMPVPAAPAAAPELPPVPSVAKLYFSTAQAALPDKAGDTLAPVIAHLRAVPSARAVISGFHDARGDKAANEALALERARTVRAALEAGGIARERIDMAKPLETEGTGNLDEARRVEVGVLQ